ncbi:MAG: hypothetical protein PHR35_07655 [Kiritimatiellae bacterium]|nr:hypothetical protein [Kiritimatiellia bacterium]
MKTIGRVMVWLSTVMIWLSAVLVAGLGALLTLAAVTFWGGGPGEPATGMSWEEFEAIKSHQVFPWTEIVMLAVGLGLMIGSMVLAVRATRARKVNRVEPGGGHVR